jgi:colicin import membrane protein
MNKMTGGPAGRRDESVSFSLRELQDLEEERLAREKRDVTEREAAVVRAREDAARREAEALAAKERAEAAAHEEQRRRENEELARREAMQKAIVEQARLEVDARTRGQERERERQHELELARLRAQQGTTKPGAIIGAGLGSALFVLAGAFAIHLAVLKPSSEARIAALTEMATRAETRANEAERRSDEQKKQIASLGEELRQAREAKPAEPPKPPSTTRGSTGRGPTTHPPTTRPKDPPPCIDPHDPMCGHIP